MKQLPKAPPEINLRLMSLGDPVAAARLLILWLQAFDNQPGISIPFKDLDYESLVGWLGKILLLDEKGQYPLLAASRIYSEVPDETKQRYILDFVYRQFFVDPNRRWPSLAHAVYIAKHRLRDFPLALKYAMALSNHVTDTKVPFWIKQMEIYVLEDMGELESAKILIGGLLESGTITDRHELMFLNNRLKMLDEKTLDNSE